MGRISWKENQLISIETRDGVFALAQMLKSPYMFFFDIFSENNNWSDVSLDEVPDLFCLAVTRQFLSKSSVTKISELTAKNFETLPDKWIQPTGESRIVTVWENTPDEKQFMIIGNGGSLIETDIAADKYEGSKVIQPFIDFDDDQLIDSHELTSLGIYAELNERLYLCYKFGRNVNPYKDLIFNRKIPIEYKRYVEIISS